MAAGPGLPREFFGWPADQLCHRHVQGFGGALNEVERRVAGASFVAPAANGAVATASSTATGSGFSPTGAINGNNRGPRGQW